MTKPKRSPSKVDISPSAARLSESLRDIGYDFESAIADLVDNSVTAGANTVSVSIQFDGDASWVGISDDGSGMTASELSEAMRFGTRKKYGDGDLGRFGLGLKTASISQCRKLSVFTRKAQRRNVVSKLHLDLDEIAVSDRWEVQTPPKDMVFDTAHKLLAAKPGTFVVWRALDRVIDLERPDSGWNRRRLNTHAIRLNNHLGMVFHRFLEGAVDGRKRLKIFVNGKRVQPWNPFAPDESTRELPLISLPIASGHVSMRRYVLPARSEFSSMEKFESMAGPNKWNRQQGFYIYRANRMIQSGGWSGLRAADEHTKLARVALDFPTTADTEFKIDVSKMRVGLPPAIKSLIVQPLNELVHIADGRYRSTGTNHDRVMNAAPQHHQLGEAGAALSVAALEEGLTAELDRVMKRLSSTDPSLAEAFGW